MPPSEETADIPHSVNGKNKIREFHSPYVVIAHFVTLKFGLPPQAVHPMNVKNAMNETMCAAND